jgi:tripartite-type tricarboxylate transporter receptor subunit TctC
VVFYYSFIYGLPLFQETRLKFQFIYLLVAFFILTIPVSPKELLAASYYEGKVINIIVGYSPGGGYDRIARLLAKHLPKYIPGKPGVIVENMPGADSMIAANYIFNIAKPDGLTIGTFNRGLPFAQLLKAPGVKYDLTKFSWIGSAASEATALSILSSLPYKTFDELLKAKSPIYLGSMGPSDSSGQFPMTLKEYLGLNMKMIIYPSSSDCMLAVERKELDGRGGSYSSLKPFVDRGLVRCLVRGRVSEPDIAQLPVDEDLAKDKTAKTIMAMRSAPDRVGRPYVAPPKTPPEVMNILRDAFAKVANDPELKADATKMMMDVNYVSADETLKIVNDVLNQPSDIAKEFSKFVKF